MDEKSIRNELLGIFTDTKKVSEQLEYQYANRKEEATVKQLLHSYELRVKILELLNHF